MNTPMLTKINKENSRNEDSLVEIGEEEIVESENELMETPKHDRGRRMGGMTKVFIPKVKKRLFSQDSPSSRGSQSEQNSARGNSHSRNVLKDQSIEDCDEYGIVQDIISEVKDYDNFRYIEKVAFKSRDSISKDPIFLNKKFPSIRTEKKPVKIQKEFLKFHAAYVDKCKSQKVLPLPLLKKIKFGGIILDNYQLSIPISKALGSTIHHLSSNIKSITLANNNMNDTALSSILSGMLSNPIESLTIHNNTIAQKSLKALKLALSPLPSQNPQNHTVKIRLKRLELVKSIHSQTLVKELLGDLKGNRQIEHLRLSSVDFCIGAIHDLAEFVVNNFSLKSLNLSWSELTGDEMGVFLEKICEVKHLQHFDISTIPIEGPNTRKMIGLLKKHILNNPSLIHLNLSSCNLRVEEIKILFEGIKKSKSLLSVHLSGNIKHENVKKILEWGDISRDASKEKRKAKIRHLDTSKISLNSQSMASLGARLDKKLQNRLDKQKRQSMMLELYKMNQQK